MIQLIQEKRSASFYKCSLLYADCWQVIPKWGESKPPDFLCPPALTASNQEAFTECWAGRLHQSLQLGLHPKGGSQEKYCGSWWFLIQLELAAYMSSVPGLVQPAALLYPQRPRFFFPSCTSLSISAFSLGQPASGYNGCSSSKCHLLIVVKRQNCITLGFPFSGSQGTNHPSPPKGQACILSSGLNSEKVNGISLDLYSLSRAGSEPSSWSQARLATESASACHAFIHPHICPGTQSPSKSSWIMELKDKLLLMPNFDVHAYEGYSKSSCWGWHSGSSG